MRRAEPDEGTDLTAWFQELGAINARLHAHSRFWTRPRGFSRKTWNFDTMLGDSPFGLIHSLHATAPPDLGSFSGSCVFLLADQRLIGVACFARALLVLIHVPMSPRREAG